MGPVFCSLPVVESPSKVFVHVSTDKTIQTCYRGLTINCNRLLPDWWNSGEKFILCWVLSKRHETI